MVKSPEGIESVRKIKQLERQSAADAKFEMEGGKQYTVEVGLPPFMVAEEWR